MRRSTCLLASVLSVVVSMAAAGSAEARYHHWWPTSHWFVNGHHYNGMYGHTVATWYGGSFIGHRTACGQIYTGRGLTAASRSLPCGKRVTVTNLQNHSTVTVVITDRGGPSGGLDLSTAARDALGAKTTIPVSLVY